MWRKKKETPETVADRIRSMKNIELVDLLNEDMCELVCGQNGVSCNGNCRARIAKWLEMPARDGFRDD